MKNRKQVIHESSNKAPPPLVSVYMATKNRAELLKRAMDSVLAQSYRHVELVVIDDGSTDETPTVLASYQQKHRQIRFYRNETSLGIAAARNRALENCQGVFVSGLDDDDYFCPSRLTTLMALYDDQYAFICSSAIWDFGQRRKVADAKRKVFNLHDQLNYNHATTQVLVKRDRILAVGGFDNELVARLDYDLWTRLIIDYGPGLRINEPSYVLNRCEGYERVTATDRDVIGNHQFLAKHRSIMSPVNLRNHVFRDINAQNKSLGLIELFRQIRAGYAMSKIKYFIRYHFFT
jgi:glycosyltransferase involved in cell wall biosynthesis